MTTRDPSATSTVPPRGRAAAPSVQGAGLSAGGLLASEVVKLLSLRSTWWLALIALLAAAGSGWLEAYVFSQPESVADLGLTPLTATRSVLEAGTQSAQLVLAILAVVVITGEYTSGTIQPTMTAVPRRLPVLAAKTVVVAAASVVSALVCSALAYAASWPLLDGAGLSVPPVSMGSTATAAALYGVLISVFALLVGTVARNTAVGVVAVLGVLMVLPIALALVPGDANLGQFSLTYGAQVISSSIDGRTGAGLGSAAAVTSVWLASASAAAVAVLVRRDV